MLLMYMTPFSLKFVHDVGYRKVVKLLLLSIPETMTIDDILSRWKRKVVQLQEHIQRMKWKMCSKFSIELKGISAELKRSDVGIRALLAESKSMQVALFDNVKTDYASILYEITRANDIAADVTSLMKIQLEGMERDKEQWDKERESFYREREHFQARELRLEESELDRRPHLHPAALTSNREPEPQPGGRDTTSKGIPA